MSEQANRKEPNTDKSGPIARVNGGAPVEGIAGSRPDQWFPYDTSSDDFGPSVIDASDWLDAPAGKHGWAKADGEKFIFEDGTPVVFWGTNITEQHLHTPGEAPVFAAKLAKYGMNAVRFHKFTWSHSGVVKAGGRSTELDPGKMKNMDLLHHEMKKRGIYVTWSHIFGHQITAADALESGFVGMEFFSQTNNSYGIINFAEDMQDLVIELTVNLLNHVNSYTGLRYAADPALAMIELQNEDNIFFCMQDRADKHPYYRKLLNAMFCEWLRERYADEAALAGAWGPESLDEGESLAGGTIYAHSNCFMFDPSFFDESTPRWRRYLDSLRFMYETQNRFYERYADAIRGAGYRGLLIGSPWMAHKGIPHYYNLHSDALVGPVDRHDYWGGGESHVLRPGKFNRKAMVEHPGTGLLRRGLERVEGVPFLMSEWNSTPPSEWLTEATFLIAAYGMGLQGWGGSFNYAIDHTHNIYDTNLPPHLAQFPALSRMLYRGDVQEGEPVRTLRLDLESFRSSPQVPESFEAEWLAAGKVGVRFGGASSAPRREAVADTGAAVGSDAVGGVAATGTQAAQHSAEPYAGTDAAAGADALWDRERRRVTSTTGQLVWDYAQGGLVTLRTPGVEGVLGRTHGAPVALDRLALSDVDTVFVNVTLASLTREPLAASGSLLLTALARSANTGMRYSDDGSELLDIGGKPLLLEPVQATVTVRLGGSARVHALDQQGRRTGVMLPAEPADDGFSFRIDGRYAAFWYEIEIA